MSFKKERANGHGHYTISANYRGREITVSTMNSQTWDWLDDNSDKEESGSKALLFQYDTRTVGSNSRRRDGKGMDAETHDADGVISFIPGL